VELYLYFPYTPLLRAQAQLYCLTVTSVRWSCSDAGPHSDTHLRCSCMNTRQIINCRITDPWRRQVQASCHWINTNCRSFSKQNIATQLTQPPQAEAGICEHPTALVLFWRDSKLRHAMYGERRGGRNTHNVNSACCYVGQYLLMAGTPFLQQCSGVRCDNRAEEYRTIRVDCERISGVPSIVHIH
jgi:hypothetical protein